MSRVGFFFVLGMVLATQGALAQRDLSIRGALHSAQLGTFRVISVVGTTATDVTAEGLRIGKAGSEERIAFCRPGLVDGPRPYINYTVVAVAPENDPFGSTFFSPKTHWDASTPPFMLLDIANKATPATQAMLLTTFTALLQGGNEPSLTRGLVVRSTGDFRTRQAGEMFFRVDLTIPFSVRISHFAPMCPDPRFNPTPAVPQPIRPFIMFWSSTLSGQADIVVNNQPAFSQSIRVTGQRIAETVLPVSILVRGDNPISITVAPADLADQAPVTVNTTLTIPDLICPFDPRLGPPAQQPFR